MFTALRIAIIGAGFSGISTAMHLISYTKRPLNIFLIDPAIKPGFPKGIAYSTTENIHLLNVRAKDMSAFEHDNDNFFAWVAANQHLNTYYDDYKEWQNINFLPRKVYGEYLFNLYENAFKQAKTKDCSLEHITEKANDINLTNNNSLTVSTDKRSLEVDKVILATGLSMTENNVQEHQHNKGVISDFWSATTKTPLKKTLKNEISIKPHNKIIIIGTGLTAVDAILSLKNAGYQGNITAISPSGTFPEKHAEKPTTPIIIKSQTLPSSLLDLINHFKKHYKDINPAFIIEGLRPYTSLLWQKFSDDEKRQFLRHLFPLWNKFRHRIAPKPAQILFEMIQEGKLQILQGRVISIKEQTKTASPFIEWIPYNNFEKTSVETDLIINCTGPKYNLNKQPKGLVHLLIEKGIAIPDSLNMGIHVDEHFSVIGKGNKKVYVLGSLLFGTLLETTAVPDIRKQAQKIALSII